MFPKSSAKPNIAKTTYELGPSVLKYGDFYLCQIYSSVSILSVK